SLPDICSSPFSQPLHAYILSVWFFDFTTAFLSLSTFPPEAPVSRKRQTQPSHGIPALCFGQGPTYAAGTRRSAGKKKGGAVPLPDPDIKTARQFFAFAKNLAVIKYI